MLPDSISPCANVRRSCNALMQDNLEIRSVSIDDAAISALADKISQSILDKFQTKIDGNENIDTIRSTSSGTCDLDSGSDKVKVLDDASESESASVVMMGDGLLDGCIKNLNFAAWDEENWHYTASEFQRPHMCEEDVQKQKFERVALYIMVMDCINFCFWPVSESAEQDDGHDQNQNQAKNLLEYEHLASALKELAAKDDILKDCDNSKIDANEHIHIVCAEDSFLLAPQNLVNLTEKSFLDMMLPLLPTAPVPVPAPAPTPTDVGNNQKEMYVIPNVKERVRLIREMAEALLTFHGGSATAFIAKAGRSADMLVHLVLQFFPGFRDATVDPHRGRWVAFYKRAQILVADLWAALCTCTDDADADVNSGSGSGSVSVSGSCIRGKFGMDFCNFVDMNKITMFADYRVPQLLRSLGVLKYSPSLAHQVDSGDELDAFTMDELYIRASTVEAVDMLVEQVSQKVSGKVVKNMEINSVKMDWFLWNIGEKLDREGNLGKHHRVRTIFY